MGASDEAEQQLGAGVVQAGEAHLVEAFIDVFYNRELVKIAV